MPMPEVEFEARIEALTSRVEPLEKLVHACATRLPAPLRYHSGKEHHGFRYGKPHAQHFCLLKAVRAVSVASAAIELARSGYAQEICVLIRTLVECTTHIEFVLSARDEGGTLEPAAGKYVQDFFADYARNDATDFKRAQVRQKMVHEMLGAELDRFVQQRNPEYRGASAETYSRTYLTFSNYVHAKYPETMELYGGQPEHFSSARHAGNAERRGEPGNDRYVSDHAVDCPGANGFEIPVARTCRARSGLGRVVPVDAVGSVTILSGAATGQTS